MDMILLAAGASKRYTTEKPKFLLPMPDGRFMFDHAIRPFLNQVNYIYMVVQEAHDDKYQITRLVNTSFNGRIFVVCLPELTKGPADTARIICNQLADKPVFIKDCDSFFDTVLTEGNFVCTTEWNNDDNTKGYVEHRDSRILSMHEKNPQGNIISVGGYGFASTKEYVKHAEQLDSTKEMFVSQVINSMLPNHEFQINSVNKYQDMGIQEKYDSVMGQV
jgi:choline kinase